MSLFKSRLRLITLAIVIVIISVGVFVSYGQGEQKFQISSLQKDLIAYWPLDGSNYNASTFRVSDKGSYENHGTNFGAMLTPGKSGDSNAAMKFGNTANQEYISAPISPVAYNLSMSAWINPTSYPSERATILVNSAAYYLSLSSDGSVQTYWYGRTPAGYHSSGAGVVPLNKWTHVSAVWSASDVKIYVNGILRNTVSIANEPGNNPNNVIIGAQSLARQFRGSISDVYVHSRALSSEEVKSLFESSKSKISFSSSQRGLIFDAPLSSRYIKEETSGAETLSNRASYEGAVLNNGAILGPDGASFNGNSWISLPYGAGVNPAISPLSFSVWVKANTPNTDMVFLSAGDSPDSNARMYLATYNGKWDMGIATSGWSSGAVAADNNWTHIALVMDGAKANLYVNGQFSINKSYSSYAFNQNFEIGRHVGGTYYWNGEISDFSIYNRILSDVEVALIYDKNRKSNNLTLTAPSVELVQLNYTAGAGGSILGDVNQFIEPGTNGTTVTAVPNSGYSFVNWSDGSTQNPRTDSSVMNNVSVTANFEIIKLSLGEVCSNNNECSSNYCYRDQDGDRYQDLEGEKHCQAQSSLGTDCYDLNADARPGQTTYFRYERGDGSWDYNCNGTQDKYSSRCWLINSCPPCEEQTGFCSETTPIYRCLCPDLVANGRGCGESTMGCAGRQTTDGAVCPTGNNTGSSPITSSPAMCKTVGGTAGWSAGSRTGGHLVVYCECR